jgi:hypothetical protein
VGGEFIMCDCPECQSECDVDELSVEQIINRFNDGHSYRELEYYINLLDEDERTQLMEELQ